MLSDPHILILGGGAAGFFAAITCAEANPHARVTILEKSRALLSKVRISGGGRCNVTHACFDPAAAGAALSARRCGAARPVHALSTARHHRLVRAARRAPQDRSDGRVFPVTDRSETIVDCLMNAAQQAGVTIRTQVSIAAIERDDRSGFVMRSKTGEALTADRVLLATGSNPQGYAWAAALGHSIEPPVPSLFTFAIDDARLQGLAGISVPNARVEIAGTSLAQSGPLLITHWGLERPGDSETLRVGRARAARSIVSGAVDHRLAAGSARRRCATTTCKRSNPIRRDVRSGAVRRSACRCACGCA